MLIQIIFSYNLIRHCNSQRLHWVGVGVVIGSYHLVEVVDHVFLRTHLNIITLQTKIIYSQLYNRMDEDDFNDFQSAPAQNPPKATTIDELTLSVHSQPAELSHNAPDLLQDLSLQPSFSQITNPPSQRRQESDNNDWPRSSQPPLLKFESQMVSAIGTNNLNFSKSHSQTDFQTQPTEIHLDYLSLGDFKVSQEKPTSEANIHTQLQTTQLANEIKEPQEVKEDVNFYFMALQPQSIQGNSLNIQSQSEPGNQDLPWQAEITEAVKPEGQTIAQEVLIDDKRKQSQQFVFQSEQHRMQQQSIVAPLQPHADPWSLKISAELVVKQEEIDTRKESEMFVLQDTKQPLKTEALIIVEQSKQFRKQSEDFVFQTVSESNEVHEVHPEQLESSSSNPQPFQTINKDMIFQRQDLHHQKPIQVEAEVYQPQEKRHQQQIKAQGNGIQEQEDDQFGQFQQTVETVQPSISVGNYHIEESNGQSQSKVQILAEKAPYDMNIPSRAQELQAFVDSLPNYSFILAQAFNSI